MSCTKKDVRRITFCDATGNLSFKYLDLRPAEPVVLTAEAYAALTLVKCPKEVELTDRVCVLPNGETDLSLVVDATACQTKTVTYSDLEGTVDEIVMGPRTLWLDDGTEATETHTEVDCPETQTFVDDFCVESA